MTKEVTQRARDGGGCRCPPIDGALRIGARENRKMIDFIQNRKPGGK